MEPELQHKQFFKSMSFFKKQLDDNQSRNKLMAELSKEVDKIIANKDSKAFHIALEKGYRPDKEQLINAFYNNVKSPLTHAHVVALFDKSLKNDILKDLEDINKTLDSALPDFITNRFPLRSTRAISVDRKINTLYFFMKSVPEYADLIMQDDNYAMTVYQLSQKAYDRIDKMDINLLNRGSALHASKGEWTDQKYSARIYNYLFADLTSIIKTNRPDLVEYINNNKEQDFRENVLNQLSKYDELLNSDIRDEISLSVVKVVKNFKESDLPSQSQNIIKEIKSIYRNLQKTQHSLDENLQIKNLFETRLPQVLQEYMMISPEYREKLKAQKENPDTLLLSSLTEIHSGLGNILEQHEEGNIKKMKVTNTYLSSLKK